MQKYIILYRGENIVKLRNSWISTNSVIPIVVKIQFPEQSIMRNFFDKRPPVFARYNKMQLQFNLNWYFMQPKNVSLLM